MKWQEMDGRERYRVVELAMKGVELSKLSREFGVSRQVLHRAMKRAEQAVREALESQRPGRKPRPEEEQRVRALEKEKAELTKENGRLKTRYEVAQAYIDLMRKLERGEILPGEEDLAQKKRQWMERAGKRGDCPGVPGTRMGIGGGEQGAGSDAAGSPAVDGTPDRERRGT